VTTAQAGEATALLRPGDGRCPERALLLLEKVAQSSTNEENRPAYRAFLELEGPARLALLRSIFVLDASPSLVEAQARIADEVRHSASREHRGAFVERLEGWWWGRICRALIDPRDASISIAEVEDALARLREAFQPPPSRSTWPMPHLRTKRRRRSTSEPLCGNCGLWALGPRGLAAPSSTTTGRSSSARGGLGKG
jgi:hypothetical protein